MMRRPSVAQLATLRFIWNVAHAPRTRGRGVARCARGGGENASVHDALLRRGLIRESSRRRYTRLTAAGMRILGVRANRWRFLPEPPDR
jgi:hypothetical protein